MYDQIFIGGAWVVDGVGDDNSERRLNESLQKQLKRGLGKGRNSSWGRGLEGVTIPVPLPP